jgi:4-amino-4-deoxy-L-arabinose transferase-like glycosyltransferase
MCRVNTASFLLIIILFLAALLRLNHINQPFTDYINWREASTAMMAENFYRGNWNIFYPEVSWDGPGPSYQGREFQTVTYLSALCYVLIGKHDWVGRCIAVVFGLWGIFALYQLVRRAWDESHALTSAAVMALLPGSIFIDRSFLPDPAMTALVVTSFWFLIAYLQTGRLRYLTLACFVGTLGFLTKIPGLIAGLPMIYSIFSILRGRNQMYQRKLFLLGASAAITLLTVAAYYLWARHLSLRYPPYHFAGAGNWIWADGLQAWLKEKYFLPKLYWNADSWLWTKPIIGLFFVGLFLPPPRKEHFQSPRPVQGLEFSSPNAPWLFHWWFMAGILYYLLGAKELVYNSWNFHILNPAVASIVGHAIISLARFGSRTTGRRLVSIAVTASIFLIIAGFGQRNLKNMYFPRRTWDVTESYKMGLALGRTAGPNDLVVTLANDVGNPVAIYYSERRGWVFPPPWPGVKWWGQFIEEDDDKAISLYDELRARGATWFGIVNEQVDNLRERHPMFFDYVKSTCILTKESKDWVIYRILPPHESKHL